MAKKIKFNLNCDGVPIRTIEDLEDNFNVNDVYDFYKEGLLLKWLEIRGYKEHYDKVLELTSTSKKEDVVENVKKLAEIFSIDADEAIIETALYRQRQEKAEIRAEHYNNANVSPNDVISDHFGEYEELINKIYDHKTDKLIIKDAIEDLATNYREILNYSCYSLMCDLLVNAPIAAMLLLVNDQTRRYYLDTDTNGQLYNDINGMSKSASDMRIAIRAMIKKTLYNKKDSSNVRALFGDNIKTYSKSTSGQYVEIEASGNNYLVLYLSAGTSAQDATSNDKSNTINQMKIESESLNFMVMDGLRFCSTADNLKIMYMEV